MKKKYLLFVIIVVSQSIYAQNTEKDITKISDKICKCINAVKTDLNNDFLTNCFKKVYVENATTMNKLLEGVAKGKKELSEAEKKGIVALQINEKLALNCDILASFYSKKTHKKTKPKFIQIMSNEICIEIDKKFKSVKQMSLSKVDPIFDKYIKKYHTKITKHYKKEDMDDFGKDIVGELMKTCTLYRKWTVQLSLKK